MPKYVITYTVQKEIEVLSDSLKKAAKTAKEKVEKDESNPTILSVEIKE